VGLSLILRHALTEILEIIYLLFLSSIKGQNKTLILKFYKAEKKEHDLKIKAENYSENAEREKQYRIFITATDQNGMFEQLKVLLEESYLDESKSSTLAFIKDICDVLKIDYEYKNIATKFWVEKRAEFNATKKAKRAEAGISEPIDMMNVPGRNAAYHTIAKAYMEENDVIFVAGALRKYKDGIYPGDTESINFVKSEIMFLALDKFNTPLSDDNVNSVLKVMKMYRTVNLVDCEPDADKVILANNKIINLQTSEVSDFTPEKIYFSKLPVDYNPGAPEPEKFIKYLDTTFKGNIRARMQLQELAGYLLCRNYKYQYVFYLLGDGGEGKGVLLRNNKYIISSISVTIYNAG